MCIRDRSNGVLGYVKENTLGKINTIREDIVEDVYKRQ